MNQSTTVSIRTATEEDIPQLLEFEQGVVFAERPHAMDMKSGHVTYYDLEELIRSPDTQLVIAEIDQRPVASGYLRIESSKAHNRSEQYGYLGFMYVDPDYRGQRINQQVMNALFDFAKSRGVTVFKLEVYASNQVAISAYEKVGFKPNLLEMVLEPDG